MPILINDINYKKLICNKTTQYNICKLFLDTQANILVKL